MLRGFTEDKIQILENINQPVQCAVRYRKFRDVAQIKGLIDQFQKNNVNENLTPKQKLAAYDNYLITLIENDQYNPAIQFEKRSKEIAEEEGEYQDVPDAQTIAFLKKEEGDRLANRKKSIEKFRRNLIIDIEADCRIG